MNKHFKTSVMDKIKKLIFNSLFPLIILLLIVAACNYITVHNHIKDFYQTTLEKEPTSTQLDCLVDSSKMISSTQRSEKSITVEKKCICGNSSNDFYYHKMMQFEKMKKYLFDSNVVTFLVTLIVALLAGFLFNEHKDNQETLEKYKKDIQDYLNRLKSTEYCHSIYARIVSIYLESQNFKKIVSIKNQILSEESWEIVYSLNYSY